jgi:hypothetical protein
MAGLVAGIHVFLFVGRQDVDGRDKPGHDERSIDRRRRNTSGKIITKK